MDIRLGSSVHVALGTCIGSLEKAGGCKDIIASLTAIQSRLYARLTKDQPRMWYVFTDCTPHARYENIDEASQHVAQLAQAGGYTGIAIRYLTEDEAFAVHKARPRCAHA